MPAGIASYLGQLVFLLAPDAPEDKPTLHTGNMYKFVMVGFMLIFSSVGCSSSTDGGAQQNVVDTTASTTTQSTTTTAEVSTTVANASSSIASTKTNSEVDWESAELWLFFLFLYGSSGIDDSTLESCLGPADETVELNGDEQSVRFVADSLQKLFACVPDEMAEGVKVGTELGRDPVAGLSTEELVCADAELFRFIGSLSSAELVELSTSVNQSDLWTAKIGSPITDVLGSVCSLDAGSASPHMIVPKWLIVASFQRFRPLIDRYGSVATPVPLGWKESVRSNPSDANGVKRWKLKNSTS